MRTKMSNSRMLPKTLWSELHTLAAFGRIWSGMGRFCSISRCSSEYYSVTIVLISEHDTRTHGFYGIENAYHE